MDRISEASPCVSFPTGDPAHRRGSVVPRLVGPSHLALLATITALIAGVGCRAAAANVELVPIELNAQRTALRPGLPAQRRAGALEHRGGLVLSSPDARFGGLSGLLVSPDGKSFVAISDRGFWIDGRLTYEGDELVGAGGATLRRMLDKRGRPLDGAWTDAEGLARVPRDASNVLVSFERQARVWRYDLSATPRRAALERPFAGLAAAEHNRGLEAIEFLADGSLLAITEATRNPAGDVIGWRRDGDGDHDVRLRLEDGWGLTSIARLPGGDVLTLERWFRPPADLRIRLRRLAAADLRGGDLLDGPVVAQFAAGDAMDNMEGLDVRQVGERVFVYLVSDDNYNPAQRTILHMFEWVDAD